MISRNFATTSIHSHVLVWRCPSRTWVTFMGTPCSWPQYRCCFLYLFYFQLLSFFSLKFSLFPQIPGSLFHSLSFPLFSSSPLYLFHSLKKQLCVIRHTYLYHLLFQYLTLSLCFFLSITNLSLYLSR